MVNVVTKPTTKKKNPLLDNTNADNPIVAAATKGIDTGGITQANLDEALRAGINVMSPKNVKLMSRIDKEALARQTAAQNAAQGIFDLMSSNLKGQTADNAAPQGNVVSTIGGQVNAAEAKTPIGLITNALGAPKIPDVLRGGAAVGAVGAAGGISAGALIGSSIATTTAQTTTHLGTFAKILIGAGALNAAKGLISSDDAVNIFKTSESDMANLITAVKAGDVTPEDAIQMFNQIQDNVNEETRNVKITTTYNPVLWIDGGKKLLIRAQKTQNDLDFNKAVLTRVLATQAAQNAVNQIGA